MGSRWARGLALVLGAGLVGGVAPAALAATGGGGAGVTGTRVDCTWATSGSVPLEQAFARSAAAADVPEPLLKAVSYMESRWDAHPGAASADGGWGPMNLTDGPAVAQDGRGLGTARAATTQQTARLAAELTGLPVSVVTSDPAANVCGGAAVLSAYQGQARGQLGDWADAVARYGTAGSGGSNRQFAQQVYATLRDGQQRTTAERQRVSLAAHPQVVVPKAAASAGPTDCPTDLGCEWVPAPYAKTDPDAPDSTGSYGNHDIANRAAKGHKGSPELRYIVIHDTEGSYDSSVALVQDPTYLGWNYTIRSSDGHVAQHMDPNDVGWHAGNWYVNMHSIGIEHEGKGGNAGWFTEAMYQNSAELVRYLAREYRIPVDRAHIIGHDQVPGILTGYTRGMHWDPGPYWDWEHYFQLLKKPLGGHRKAVATVNPGDAVVVRPGYDGNAHPITQCEEQSPGSGPCIEGAPTNFVPLRQAPSEDAPLAKDVAVRPGSDAGTTVASDVSARAEAGDTLVVADVQGEWVKVSWAGEFAWLRNPADDPVLVPTHAWTVTVRDGAQSAPVYGRAYPEASAYPETIPVQAVSPIEYTLKPGQAYALTDDRVVTDYYRAVSFDGSAPGDRTDVVGQDRYLQISLAHRIAYVRAADVEVHRN